MNEENNTNKNTVIFESRDQKFLTCPHCWTDQRTERNFCYRCGTGFLYRDEQEQPGLETLKASGE